MSSFQRRFNLFLGKLSRPLNLLAQRMWYPKGEKCKALGTEEVCWNTKLHLLGLFRTMRIYRYDYIVMQYKCTMIYSIYVWKNTFMHSGLHIQPLRGFLHVFSSHAWGASCLKSWNRTQIENQIANKQKWQQQKWNLIKTDKNDKNRMAFFNGF